MKDEDKRHKGYVEDIELLIDTTVDGVSHYYERDSLLLEYKNFTYEVIERLKKKQDEYLDKFELREQQLEEKSQAIMREQQETLERHKENFERLKQEYDLREGLYSKLERHLTYLKEEKRRNELTLKQKTLDLKDREQLFDSRQREIKDEVFTSLSKRMKAIKERNEEKEVLGVEGFSKEGEQKLIAYLDNIQAGLSELNNKIISFTSEIEENLK